MKILILGAGGMIGTAMAYYLSKQSEVTQIGIADSSPSKLADLQKRIQEKRNDSHLVDLSLHDSVESIIRKYDVILISLPYWSLSYRMIELAIKHHKPAVDILEEYHRHPTPSEIKGFDTEGLSLAEYGDKLHEDAIKAGITIIDGLGFAPGLTNITSEDGIRSLDKVTSVIARAGGIPEKVFANQHPLQYSITWSFEHVLREYDVPVPVIHDGKVSVLNPLDGFEICQFDALGQDETLECVATAGMPSFLYTRQHLQTFAEKTIRWPGHWDAIKQFRDCGMLEDKSRHFKHGKDSPRNLLCQILEPLLRKFPNEHDVCIMYNSIEGTKDGKEQTISYYMWDVADLENGVSSMARVTGYTAAVGAMMLLEGKINDKGILAPEDCIYGDAYNYILNRLRKENINIEKIVS